MQVTDVRIDRLINRGNYKAECSVKLDNDLLLTGIIVAKGARDYYIKMPQRITADGRKTEIYHPLNQETRLILENHIINAYQMEVEQ